MVPPSALVVLLPLVPFALLLVILPIMVELPLPLLVVPLLLVEEHDDTFHNPCATLAKGTKRDSDDLLLNSEKEKRPMHGHTKQSFKRLSWASVLRFGKVRGTSKNITRNKLRADGTCTRTRSAESE